MQLEGTGEKTKDQAQLLVDLGRLELLRSNLDGAEDYLTRGLTLMQELEGPRSSEIASILSDISNVRSWRDDLEGAESAARQAVNISKS